MSVSYTHLHSFDDVPVEDMEESYVSSLDDIPPHPLDSVTVISDDGEVLERPMDSGAHIEVEAVPKSDGGEQQQGTPYQSDDHTMLSQAPIEVAPIDSVTVAREYAWDPEPVSYTHLDVYKRQRLGIRSVAELVGRIDLVRQKSQDDNFKLSRVDLKRILFHPYIDASVGHMHTIDQDHELERTLDMSKLLRMCRPRCV